MSGGVDSAVALLRAGSVGDRGDAPALDRSRGACFGARLLLAGSRDRGARDVPRLGIPHVTLDAREEFRRAIVQPFVDGYARGETPNPCTRCNGSFRFAQLLAFARRAGASRLATGHYARIVEHRGARLLARARDPEKDQSYMLAGLDPKHLERIWFPLGDQSKDETRAEAERAGLAVARRAESQEACFLGGGDYRDFLERHGLAGQEGRIVDEQGTTLGTHQGFWRFTPGQRRGLGVSTGSPAYAIGSDPGTNTVVVGPREALARRTVRASGRLFASVTRGDVEASLSLAGCPGGRRGVWRTVSGFGSTSPRTASRRARPLCCTRETSSSERAESPSAPHDPQPKSPRVRYALEARPRPPVTDEITLTIPRDRALYGVAHLVLGGLGIRLNLTIENLEDLEIALDAVLDSARDGENVTIAMRVGDGAIQTRIGPMNDGIRGELEQEGGDGVGLRRILDAVVDGVEVESDDRGDWVRLTKAVEAQA